MRIKKEYDAIVIGAGNMGLTLAAYLQRSGMQTAVFERRHEEGSAIFTSECTAPGLGLFVDKHDASQSVKSVRWGQLSPGWRSNRRPARTDRLCAVVQPNAAIAAS